MSTVTTLSYNAKLILLDDDEYQQFGRTTPYLALLSDAELTAALDELQAAGLTPYEVLEV